jgi:hypothetical protein
MICDEFLDENPKGKTLRLLTSMFMITTTKGHEYTYDECREWCTELGFT